VHDDLRARIGCGLEQHRVHVAGRCDGGGLRLQRLGATDLSAVDGNGAIQGHILRFEGRHAHATSLEHAAQAGHKCALASIGGGSLNHEAAIIHGW